MIAALFQIFAAVPILTVALVVVGAWLLRRRPGRLRHAWLVGFGALLVAADEVEELPLPDPDPGPATATKSVAVPTRHTLEFGLGGGSFQTCAGPRRYGDVGAMYRYTTPISSQTNVTVDAGTYGAWSGTPSGGVRGSVGLDHRWAAGSVGVVAGALERETVLELPVMPTASLRIGPRDVAFVEWALLQDSPAPLPGPILRLGAGVAFPAFGNDWEPLTVRAGVSGLGVYLAPTIPIGEVGNLEVTASYGDTSTWGLSATMRVHVAP